MNISLDYDDTFTRDPQLWKQFCLTARQRGHKVFLVTMRYPEEMCEPCKELTGVVDEFYPTSRQAKKPFLESLGIRIDVWIDDNPFFILRGASQ